MRKYIQLSIPEPCHEDWDKMTTVDKGKFCGACQKEVIDFTTMSDEQLVAFQKTNPELVEGGFYLRPFYGGTIR